MQPPQRDIVFRKTISIWGKSSTLPITYDLTASIYGSLDFLPDSVIIKEISYISGNEQNSNINNQLSCDFINPGNSTQPIGNGSINHPNTLYDVSFIGDASGTTATFELKGLVTEGVIGVNQLNKSTWFCTMEFVKYGNIVELT
jgi:hypothetical protein